MTWELLLNGKEIEHKRCKDILWCILPIFAGGKRTLQSWSSIPCRIGNQRNVLCWSRAVLLDCAGYLSTRNDLGILDAFRPMLSVFISSGRSQQSYLFTWQGMWRMAETTTKLLSKLVWNLTHGIMLPWVSHMLMVCVCVKMALRYILQYLWLKWIAILISAATRLSPIVISTIMQWFMKKSKFHLVKKTCNAEMSTNLQKYWTLKNSGRSKYSIIDVDRI